jgi:predicted NUDIX family NTP pyrophosphohydrolase
MATVSAGILMYRMHSGTLEIFLVHPGGPFWTKKDLGAWSIPKGEIDADESPLEAALREFEEETGVPVSGHYIPLTPVRLKSRKVIRAWAVEGDIDPSKIRSNTFTMEWPPHSGKKQDFPEIDRASWFNIEDAKRKINQGQAGLLEELEDILKQRKENIYVSESRP